MKHRGTWSAGHGYGSRDAGKTDPGAVSKYGVEADLARELTLHLAQDSAACMIPTLFRDKGRYYLADDQADAFDSTRFAEIHFNAASAAASGVEVLVGPRPSDREMEWARDTGRTIATTLGIPYRGVKVRDDLAVLRQYRDMASILIEVGFITNKLDMSRFHTREDALELAMFNAYRKSIGRAPMTKLPRKTWRKVRIARYLKVI
jgi:N-acetylmuramoyl-L-alanine amidase